MEVMHQKISYRGAVREELAEEPSEELRNSGIKAIQCKWTLARSLTKGSKETWYVRC